MMMSQRKLGDFDDEDHESSLVSSSHDASTERNSSEENFKEVTAVTRKENEQVEMWRDLVTGMLIITACFVTCASYIYLSRNETQSFKDSFQQDVGAIADGIGRTQHGIGTAFRSLRDKLISHAQSSGSEWPMVTMPFFDIHGADVRDASGVEFFSFCPLVMEFQKSSWEHYSVANQWWIQGGQDEAYTEEEAQAIVASFNQSIPEYIYGLERGKPTIEGLGVPPYAPRWQMSPLPENPMQVNFDVKSAKGMKDLFDYMILTGDAAVSDLVTERFLDDIMLRGDDHTGDPNPKSIVFYPVLESFKSDAPIVGFFEIILDWKTILKGLLPGDGTGLFYVISSSCGRQYTWELRNGEITYIGEGNLHDIYYSHLEAQVEMPALTTQYCTTTLLVYPSSELRRTFSSSIPEIFAGIVAVVFFVMAFFFFAYDKYVQDRNRKVINQAVKTNAIVSSFFPKNIRDRLFDNKNDDDNKSRASMATWTGKLRLKSYLNDGENDAAATSTEDKPIADLFPNCTVLFADIVGFTAWSSMREPGQVLLLLETIYRAFDEIAKRRKVFKVETIGDCYVAVTGLPEPNKLHALVMARFAKDCMFKLHEVVRGLEVSLGPDTGDLSMRIGLHSGPVTAGVLRADRLRFQLFGDTVNTASRIESTGKRGCIHLSKETADLLANGGKSAWIRERADRVTAKGKGELTTFWLSMSEQSSCGDMEACSPDLSSSNNENGPMKSACYFGLNRSKVEVSAKTMRLVRWNVDVLHGLLRQIAAVRNVRAAKQPKLVRSKTADVGEKEKMVLDEVAEVIRLPKLNSKVAHVVAQSKEADVPQEVLGQLHDFVTKLAGMYHSNPFHNFEHASHVTMSVVKLLSRIIAPKDMDFDEAAMKDEKKFMATVGSKMHDHTYGITSDPLTQFSVVLAALIHDVDHLGVPNAQLVKEETETAKRYKGKSVAEQNSVDLAWQLLMQPDYKDLRRAIGATDTEWARFRQLVVNSVMATDIVDKELKEARNARWDKAFKGKLTEEDPETDQNRKATIVIEHLIQASDVSHTMQHWHIYRKWNENFFKEMYRAYKEGRAEKDPSEFWYKGEIGFFDFYIIPLAKKLKDCGVFGVSSDEYLNYAEQNLAEWKSKGEQVVEEMIRKVKEEYGEGNDSDQDSTTRHADDDIFEI